MEAAELTCWREGCRCTWLCSICEEEFDFQTTRPLFFYLSTALVTNESELVCYRCFDRYMRGKPPHDIFGCVIISGKEYEEAKENERVPEIKEPGVL